MSLRIRRGLESQRNGRTFDLGELIYTTDTKKLYIGDGITEGGIDLITNSVNAVTTVNEQIGDVVLTTADIPEGAEGPYYYTSAQALNDVGINLENTQHAGIQFDWTGSAIAATVLVDGTTIQVNEAHQLEVIGGGGGTTLPADAAGVLTNDGAGTLTWEPAASGGITQLADDTTPNLGGNLDLSTYNINGTGNINITGGVTASGDLSISGVYLGTGEADLGPNFSSPAVKIGSTAHSATLQVTSNNNFMVNTGVTTGVNTSGIVSKMSRGTVDAPTAILNGDPLCFIEAQGYDGSGWVQAGAFGLLVGGAVSTGTVPASFGVLLPTSGSPALMTFDNSGVLTTPTLRAGDGTAANPSIGFTTDGSTDTGIFHPGDGILCISTDATERVRVDSGGMRVAGFMKVADVAGVLPSPAEAGMIVLDGSTFKGYNGSTWVTLG